MSPLSPRMLSLLAECCQGPVPIQEAHSTTAAALLARGAVDYHMKRTGAQVFLRATAPGRRLYEYASAAKLVNFKDELRTVGDTKRRGRGGPR